MPDNLTLLRERIDGIDTLIINSLFDGFSPSLNHSKSISDDDMGELMETRLHFSEITWQLLEKRMDIAREIGQEKKGM